MVLLARTCSEREQGWIFLFLLFFFLFSFVSTVLGYIVFVHFSLLTLTKSKPSHIFVPEVVFSAA